MRAAGLAEQLASATSALAEERARNDSLSHRLEEDASVRCFAAYPLVASSTESWASSSVAASRRRCADCCRGARAHASA